MNQTVLPPEPHPTAFARPDSAFAMHAFTLIEVTFALGIISFAFVAMFGLIPIGLKTARNAMDASTGSQIVQRVVTQVKQTDFAKLDKFNKSFDDQANMDPVEALKIYDAQVTVNKDVILPGATANTSLARVTIEVVTNPGRKANAFDGSIPKKVYSAYVARSTGI